MKPEIEDRLNRSEIQVAARGLHHCMFLRDGCLAVVPCEGETFGAIGSTGLAVDRGLGYLVYRDGGPVLAGRDFEIPAEPAQVEKILKFSADLKSALE